jgi:hypothetical protein
MRSSAVAFGYITHRIAMELTLSFLFICVCVKGSEHEDYVMEMIDREADGSDSLEVRRLEYSVLSLINCLAE